MQEITLEATIKNIDRVTAFVDGLLGEAGCPLRAQMQIDLAIDELFSNIARYAYAPQTGMATVQVEIEKEPQAAVVTFIDEGVPYNPMLRENPDVNQPFEKRVEGGLGIFLVRKSMDALEYEYADEKNIFRVKKLFWEGKARCVK